MFLYLFFFFFFFQAEDGIRDVAVTGVQTCALPIFELQLRELSQKSLVVVEAPRAEARGRVIEHAPRARSRIDRKSTRLNSSHGYISYAVFCLKKKKKKKTQKDNERKIKTQNN